MTSCGTVDQIVTSSKKVYSAWERASHWAWMAHIQAMRLSFYLSTAISLGSYLLLPIWLMVYNTAVAEKQSLAMEMVHKNMKEHRLEVYIHSAFNNVLDFVHLSSFRLQYRLMTLEETLKEIPDPAIVKITNYVSGNALPIVILIGLLSFIMEFLMDPWVFLEALFGKTRFSSFVRIFGTISHFIFPTIWLSPITAVFYFIIWPFSRT